MVRMVSTTDDSSRKRSFLDSYCTADVAESYLIDVIDSPELSVHEYGIDRRHEDLSADEIDGAPDLEVCNGGDRRSFLEVKAKQSSSWMLVTNEYAFERYVEFTDEHDVPVYIGWVHLDDTVGEPPLAVHEGAEWTHLDRSTKTVHETQFVEVKGREQIERDWTAPDGNRVVQLCNEDAQSFEEFERQITVETET